MYIRFANIIHTEYNCRKRPGGGIFTDNRFDLHLYTNNTKGGNDKVSFLCETAVAEGLRAVAFTDRCDIDLFEKYDSRRRLRHSFFDMARAKSVFFDSILVLCGIEFSQAVSAPELVNDILGKQNYDIVLSCVERNADGSDFSVTYDMPQSDFNDFAAAYSDLLLKTVSETDFDVLSKPLAPLRNTNADLTFFGECMKPVIAKLAQRQKALEINTKDLSGSDRIRDLYTLLLTEFKKRGGEYIVIGSEAHFHEEVGNGIDIAQTAAKMAGFGHISLFDKRIPYRFDI